MKRKHSYRWMDTHKVLTPPRGGTWLEGDNPDHEPAMTSLNKDKKEGQRFRGGLQEQRHGSNVG